ncbi:LysR substrate-binding domain-containing protein [Photobacterium sanctipauli]|nr:LysR substrate-binding domain-containing protein [Photobacterium sanctipauli]
MSTKGLPPLNSLVMFEAAARYCSFTLAADELCVTQAAVSRQIRLLEEHLGRSLFIRKHRTLELTAAGKDYASSISQSLADILAATQAASIASTPTAQKLTIVAGQCFTSFWLMPRLNSFQKQHPDIQIHITVDDQANERSESDYDLAFFYSGQPDGVAGWHRLFEENVFPVCSPSYLAQAGGEISLTEIWQHTLLMMDSWPENWENWESWALREGIEYQQPSKALFLAEQTLIVQAAVQDCGIALVWDWHVHDLIKQGKLVPLVDRVQKRVGSFYLSQSKLSDRRINKLFLDWVETEVSCQKF